MDRHPSLFTLGVSAAMVAGPFFENSIASAIRLGRRAVLIVGKDHRFGYSSLPDGVVAFDYALCSELFPRASVVVHAGGIGTSGLAMRSGRPMLIVPYAHGQPDNADRLDRMGIARTVSRRRYTSAHIVAELGKLLGDPTFSRRAAEVGEQIQQEDGVRTAWGVLEALLQDCRPPGAVIN